MKLSAVILVAASGLALATKTAPHAPKESQHLNWDKVHAAQAKAAKVQHDTRAVHAPKESQHLNWDKVHAARVKAQRLDSRAVAAHKPTKDLSHLKYKTNHEDPVAKTNAAFDAKIAKQEVKIQAARKQRMKGKVERRARLAPHKPTKDLSKLKYKTNHEDPVAKTNAAFDAKIAKQEVKIQAARKHHS